MRKMSLAIFALSVSIAAVETTEAQIVQVEPGYIRAPFVRVYRTPDGGRRVRAPFTDVYTPGIRNPNDLDPQREHGPHAQPGRPPRAAGDRAGLPARPELGPQEQLRRRLAAASQQFDQDLADMEGGAEWQEFLQLPADTYAGLHPKQPTLIDLDLKPQYFEQPLARFDRIAQDEQYSMISEMRSFQDTYQHLVSYYESLTTSKLPPPPTIKEQVGQPEELPTQVDERD